jgi:exosortase
LHKCCSTAVKMQVGTAVQPATSQGRSVFTWAAFAAVVGLISALYVNVIADLAQEWWTVDASSYGMLVPVITGYIVYLRWGLTARTPVRTDLRGLWLTAFACVLFLLGRLAAEFFLSRVSLVVLLAGLTWTFWGLPRFRTLIFAFILLSTMVPLPAIVYNLIAAPLQLFASAMATDLAQAMGASVFRDGNIIQLAKTSLGVAEACSGLNSLSALAVASLLLGFLEDATVLGRIALVMLSAPTAIAVNVVRITGTALLADYRVEFAMGFYHLLSGWLVFVIGFGLLWAMAKVLFKWLGRAA